ncbi:hypothetical protein GGR52DRAFT_27567 [Hypoxylon sp. FL1284]|nr:hypothetical protein GGR52DRAFT_27567 [Hypoxylon sp. FL1284]
MATRRVIADSDDESGDEDPPSPDRPGIMGPPEVEPLSPQRDPSSSGARNQPSDSTDQSFFASVYDEQQSRAAQQSQLVEHIIRQSQRASRSSGEASLPAGAWDVPSSPEGAEKETSAKSSRGKNEKSYGKRRRGSKAASSPAAAKIFMGDDGSSASIDYNANAHNDTAKKRKVSLHDSVPQEASTTANFYIAQSNLTTMQKLEYQKVSVPRNSYPGLPGSLNNNQKSSGMTTIAYSTPSRYASSSGPPLPWERSPAPEHEPGDSNIIDITSSPDIIAAGHDFIEEAAVETTYEKTHSGLDEVESATADSTPKAPQKKKGKKRLKDTQEEDELDQDELGDPEVRKDRKRRRSEQNPQIDSSAAHESIEDIDLVPNLQEEPPVDDVREPEEFPADVPATEPPPPDHAPEPSIPEVQPAPQPKKRGRKKKQPVSEEAVVDEQAAPVPIAEIQPEPEKPKKKRGRPRKSDTEKAEKVAAVEPKADSTSKSHEDDIQRDELASEETPVNKGKLKTKKTAKQADVLDEATNEQVTDEGGRTSPLKEISRNSRTPSEKSKSLDEKPEDAGPDQNLTPNQAVPSKPTPASTPSQPKVPYRVGLSKRSRITSLLKSIKR